MQRLEKQVFSVQLTPSSQSESSQHSAHSPPAQHFCVPAHLGDVSQVPSALHKSLVQASSSLQSSGPPHFAAPSPPVPALPLVPPVPVLPPWLAPAWLLDPAVLGLPA
jgi:hypothetical protein